MADDVQPDEGQGEAGEGGLFGSYLQSVPEDARDYVRPYLEDASKNINARLEEAATLKPYQTVEGLTQYQPSELQQLIGWHQQVTSSDEAYQQWLTQASQDAGLTKAEVEAAVEESPDLTRESIAQMVQEQAQTLTSPLQERLETFEFNQAVSVEDQLIEQAIQTLETENNIKLTPEQRTFVLDLGMAAMPGEDQTLTAGHDWVKAGFDRLQEIGAQAQKMFVEEKLAQPKPVLTAGGVGTFELPKTWGEAGERAKERLRQSRT